MLIDMVLIPIILLSSLNGLSNYFANSDLPRTMMFNLNTNFFIGLLIYVFTGIPSIIGLAIRLIINTLIPVYTGKTLGLYTTSLSITNFDGSKPKILRLFIWNLLSIFSILLFFMGYIWILFNKNKMALHDQICKIKVS